MIAEVSKSIKNPPSLIQFAKNDVWEQTWNIDPSVHVPTPNEIRTYLAESAFDKFALEIVFPDLEGIFVLGLVFNNSLKANTPQVFAEEIIKATTQYTDFASFVSELNNSIVGFDYILKNPPDLIRIGIFNHWFSTGPIDLWKKEMGTDFSIDKIGTALATRPEIASTTLNFQGMSFITNPANQPPGLRHWIKSPCSVKNGDNWDVDPEIVAKYLKLWMGFNL